VSWEPAGMEVTLRDFSVTFDLYERLKTVLSVERGAVRVVDTVFEKVKLAVGREQADATRI